MKKYLKENAVFLIAAAVVAGLLIFVVGTVKVDGNSMNDTYKNGDVLYYMKVGTPEKGDVIICDAADGRRLIKRVIASAGDTVDIDFEAGTVSVNGELLDEPYIKEPTHHEPESAVNHVTVPDGCFYVMGDNRNASDDSRNPVIGFIPESKIVGKVLTKSHFFSFMMK